MILEEFVKYIKTLESNITKLQKAIFDLTLVVEFNKNKANQLEIRILTLENQNVETPVDCSKIEWDSDNFRKIIKDDTIVYILATKNTGKKLVEFKSDYETWKKGQLTFKPSNKCENVWFRVEGCVEEIWGCVQPGTPISKVEFITNKC